MSTLRGYGLGVDLPQQWEGRIYQRPVADQPIAPSTQDPAAQVSSDQDSSAQDPADQAGRNHPVLHLANFALPGNRGDFGTGAVERMGSGHAFIALVEFGADCLGSALYAPQGFPQLHARDFNPNGLQRRIAGQAGFQHFFTAAGRPLCLYVVLGAHRQAAAMVGQLNQLINGIEVAA